MIYRVLVTFLRLILTFLAYYSVIIFYFEIGERYISNSRCYLLILHSLYIYHHIVASLNNMCNVVMQFVKGGLFNMLIPSF